MVRIQNKFPILSYYDHETKAAIWRSSEPHPAINSQNGSIDDEAFIKALSLGCTGKTHLYIFSPRQGFEKVITEFVSYVGPKEVWVGNSN